MTITFTSGGQTIQGEVFSTGFIGEQKWLLVESHGIDWAVPQGWPNNAQPICKESEPAAYAEIAQNLSA